MRQAVLALFSIVLDVGGCASDSGKGDCWSSAPGESCAKTTDCACSYSFGGPDRVDLVCQL